MNEMNIAGSAENRGFTQKTRLVKQGQISVEAAEALKINKGRKTRPLLLFNAKNYSDELSISVMLAGLRFKMFSHVRTVTGLLQSAKPLPVLVMPKR